MDSQIKTHARLTPSSNVQIGFWILMELQKDIIVKQKHNVGRRSHAKEAIVGTLPMVTMTSFAKEKLELHVLYPTMAKHATKLLSINVDSGLALIITLLLDINA